MSKKRVHELAKEFELDNKVVIKLLQQAGISVKTHSSSVYEDEARAVLEKEASPKQDTKGDAKRPGLRIVKKSKQTQDDEVESAQTNAGQVADVSEASGADVGVQTAAEAAVEYDARELRDSSARHVESSGDEASMGESTQGEPWQGETGQALEVGPNQGAEQKAAEARDERSEEPVAPAPPAQSPANGAVAAEAPRQEAASSPAKAEGTPAAGEGTERKELRKSKPGGAQVVRMIDRDKLLERVPSNRLGGGGPGGASGGGAGGGRSFGQVTEFKVVNDPFGRGREMVAVGRDKKGRPAAKRPTGGEGGGRGARAGGGAARRGMRERNVMPSRLRRKKTTKKGGKMTEVTQPKASKRVVKMKETISVADLARELQLKAGEVIRKLMGLDLMVGINDHVDFETAQLVAADFDYTVESVAFDEGDRLDSVDMEDAAVLENLVSRPPVVTIMGHVDHGKTSLLDAIREAKVAAGEAGGITQHIGAYSVEIKGRGTITFLDTPGHAAFTEMRARGANVTDIVVLVVAADDGVMPQTEEAIRHAQAAKVPIIVAINKMDRPEANPDRVLQELTKFNLLPEDWGGDTLFVKTSALKKEGLDELLDAILLQAEVLELKASETVNAIGVVIEAQLDKGRGPVATVLVQHGILHRGDSVVVGEFPGRVRAMTNHLGKQVKEARPSDAVEIIGLDGVPNAGDAFNKVENAQAAQEVAAHRVEQRKAREAASASPVTLDELMKRMSGGGATELNIVLKADVQGSVEAVRTALEKLSTDEVAVKILHAGVGGIKESDIMLATASKGIILGFNVRPDGNARSLALSEGVEIRTYTIIYEMIDDVKKAMEGLLAPDAKEKVIGRAEVRDTFRISKVGTIAGCRVTEGKAVRSARVRLLRDNTQIFDGKISSLKHFKEDAREVESGQECGIGLDGYQDIKAGDVIEFYEVEQVTRTLDTPASAKRPSAKGPVQAHP